MNEQTKKADPPPRMGPRPLALHLGLATTSIARHLAGLPMAKEGSLPWPPELLTGGAEALGPLSQAGSGAEYLENLGRQGSSLVQEMIDGIRQYHRHPYQRVTPDHPVLWQSGTTKLLDCHPSADDAAPTVLLVPSLVNRAYILDLMPGRSLVAHLAEQGVRPLLLDWDAPGEQERDYTLADYILRRICPALDVAREMFPASDLHLAGYCMGGTLALAAAEQRQEKLKSFIALASPWDFHADLDEHAKTLLGQTDLWSNVLNGFGELPVDLLQTLFTSLDPNLGLRKFSMFSKMDMTSERATEFVALEDWLNDGIPLVRNVAAECFRSWYGDNAPKQGQWKIDGQVVSPAEVTLPALIAVPKTDKIVPRPSALGLAEMLPNATVVTPPSGHIGMITSRQAKAGLWQDLSHWILSC
ncbi:alpha/beta fold hydrolase [Sneathiella marina]|uniref:Alpha/beta fold hydrolase n=1 Tax=Sneathiella marina TaxID=2950108 RepID=A0ABY4W5V3_9PROT|nr:alpha/beta fold hydrolase [Sneathiella marina]USG61090.1 alpha/beta fold hydrolase [Sneathiella marina]